MAKSAVDPKHYLLVVDLFTSKVYVYPKKNRTLLAKKLEIFYNDIKSKRSGKMRLQYVRNEDFNPFLYNSFEINLTLKILKPELKKFYKNLEKFTPRLIKFLKYAGYKRYLIDMPHVIEKMFVEYLEEQFKEVIILNSKYSSGLFTTIEGIFFERIYQ